MSDAEKWLILSIRANETRRMHSTRTQDVLLQLNGVELAQKTIMYKRGKRVSESFLIYPAGEKLIAKQKVS
jgi:hypothetical protein